MTQTALINDIQEFNMSYLLLAQRLLHSDRDSAKFRLKLDDEMADLLVSLTTDQMLKLARCNQFICRLGLDGIDKIKTIIDSPKDKGLASTHAAILLASHPAGENT